ncbi:hypothetical protein G6F63_013440 [Rhizopus arrhizus]|nr:hypothetical protein G6F63_013440 [Rhizopus arrhizus]
MVRIVVPLGVVPLGEQAGAVVVVFQHQVDVALRGDLSADELRELHQPIRVGYRVYRVQPQAVETEFRQPVQGVLFEIAAHRRLAEIDRVAPGRGYGVAEERRSVLGQKITVRAEMGVDHVQHHAHPQAMRRVDQMLERVRRSIGRVRRIRQYAVITPVARAGKVRDGHQFDDGDAQRRQARQPFGQPRKAARQARVRFIDDGFRPRPAMPGGMLPGIGVWRDAGSGTGRPSPMRERYRVPGGQSTSVCA